jgi:hypothetical protein
LERSIAFLGVPHLLISTKIVYIYAVSDFGGQVKERVGSVRIAGWCYDLSSSRLDKEELWIECRSPARECGQPCICSSLIFPIPLVCTSLVKERTCLLIAVV